MSSSGAVKLTGGGDRRSSLGKGGGGRGSEEANTKHVSFPHADAWRTPADSQRPFSNRKTQFRHALQMKERKRRRGGVKERWGRKRQKESERGVGKN